MNSDTDMNRRLYMACLRGDREDVAGLLAAGADVNAANSQGNAPLHAAARGGHRALAAYLLKQGADMNACNGRGITPLYLALARLSEAKPREIKQTCAGLLLAAGAEPGTGRTPVRHLLRAFVRQFHVMGKGDFRLLNHDDAHCTAAQFGWLLRHMVDNGLELNAGLDEKGRTLMHYLCKMDDPPLRESVEMLVARGADPNIADADGVLPSHLHMENSYVTGAGIRWMAGLGFDMTGRTRDGETPLHRLCRKGRKLALAGHTERVTEAYRDTIKDAVETLVALGNDGNEEDDQEMSPLMHVRARIGNDRDKRLHAIPIMQILRNGVGADREHPGGSRAAQFAYVSAC